MLIYHFDLSYNPKSEVIGLARRLFKRGFNGGVYFWLNTLMRLKKRIGKIL